MQIPCTNLFIDEYEGRNGLLCDCWQDLEDGSRIIVTITHGLDGWLVCVRGTDGSMVKVRQQRDTETVVAAPVLLYDDEDDLQGFEEFVDNLL